jgi:hypothetical protein
VASQNAALAAKRAISDRARPGQPTKEYAAFLKYQAEYAAAQDAKSLALAEHKASGKALPPELDQDLQEARSRWNSLGYKVSIQNALKALRKVYDTNALALFQNLRADFIKARVRGNQNQDWLPVTTNPPVEQWLSGTGWHPLTFRQADLQAPAAQEEVPLPLDRRRGASPTPAWSPGLTLTVQVKRVNVSRPWMDLSIFSAHTWALSQATGFERVSSGNPADQEPGPMPIIITGILLARKLELAGYPGKLPGRLGPFGLGGAKPDGTTISVPDPQIIAFFCQVVPKSPSPDPKLFK